MSRYSNYKSVNNLKSELSTAISSSAITVQLNSGEGERRGTDFPMIATIESFNANGTVAKREIVIITSRSGDVLTITRKAFECFPTDEDNSLALKSRSFDPGDTISNYIAKEYIDRISLSINDLYNNGNDRLRVKSLGGLNIEVSEGNARVGTAEIHFDGGTATLTDNATNYVELTGASQINVSTVGRDTKFCKLAKITTANGSITNIEHRKMDTVGGVMSASAGFKNISNCVYNARGELVQFVADSVQYNLTYEKGALKTISFGEALYTMTYSNGRLVSAIES